MQTGIWVTDINQTFEWYSLVLVFSIIINKVFADIVEASTMSAYIGGKTCWLNLLS